MLFSWEALGTNFDRGCWALLNFGNPNLSQKLYSEEKFRQKLVHVGGKFPKNACQNLTILMSIDPRDISRMVKVYRVIPVNGITLQTWWCVRFWVLFKYLWKIRGQLRKFLFAENIYYWGDLTTWTSILILPKNSCGLNLETLSSILPKLLHQILTSLPLLGRVPSFTTPEIWQPGFEQIGCKHLEDHCADHTDLVVSPVCAHL